jgi:uncharacterized membrane protein
MESLIEYADIIVFFHILGAIIWIGGMVVIKLVVHPIIHLLKEADERIFISLEISKRLFKLMATFIAVVMITGLMMAIATNGHHTNRGYLFIIKESIWTVMALNYIFMIFRLKRARSSFDSGGRVEAVEIIKIVPNILLPINIALGIVALYIGVKLRGF